MTGPIVAVGSVGGPTTTAAYAPLTASSTSSLRSRGTTMRVAATHACPAVAATTATAPAPTRSTASGR